MRAWAGIAGAVLVAVVLWDAFETIVLPRRVTRRVRLTRFFYRATWRPFAASAGFVRAGDVAIGGGERGVDRRREQRE